MEATPRMQQLLFLVLAAFKWTENYNWETNLKQNLDFYNFAASFQMTPSHPISGILCVCVCGVIIRTVSSFPFFLNFYFINLVIM